MELWIRSQDKDMLLKVRSLLIDDDNYDIYTQDYVGNNLVTYTLGRFKTKERVLEVLDEIQRLIEDLQYMSYEISDKEVEDVMKYKVQRQLERINNEKQN